ncbi:MAG: sigma-70 family RNA polymerase sigma factor [Acidobacteria bacterium]|nr:sigma-70 family RNA polymerase sigma factor [Acidobacteriota bacterium]
MLSATAPAPARSPSSADVEWAKCIREIAEGDALALARLYDRSSSLIYGLTLRMLGNAEDAEEVTLDVYAQVWRSARSFDADRGTPSAWLVMLARSRALDRLRAQAQRRSRERAVEAPPNVPDRAVLPDESTALDEQRRRVQAALAVLSAEQRALIEMAFFAGFSHSELASRTGLPLGTVKTRIRMGMIKLRELLSESGEAL